MGVEGIGPSRWATGPGVITCNYAWVWFGGFGGVVISVQELEEEGL